MARIPLGLAAIAASTAVAFDWSSEWTGPVISRLSRTTVSS